MISGRFRLAALGGVFIAGAVSGLWTITETATVRNSPALKVVTSTPLAQKERCYSCSPPSNQHIYIPLASLPEAVGGEIVFNSRSGHTIPVTPIFYRRDGETIIGDTVDVQPAEIRYVDIKDLLPKRHRFDRNFGGFALSYYGANREMWAQFRFVGVNGGGTIDEFFSVQHESRAKVYEAAWWIPENSTAIVALGNISDEATACSLSFDNGEIRTFSLAPHATEVVTVESHVRGVQSARLNVIGTPGSVIPTGLITAKDGSFNSVIRFYDPNTAQQQNLFANGFRIAGSTPHMVLKNTTSNPLVVAPTVLPFSGKDKPLALPQIVLGANETTEVDLLPVLQSAKQRDDLNIVSVEVSTNGAAGSIIGALYATNKETGIQYEAPLRDSGPIRSMTGIYPWKISKNFRTIAYITNVSAEEATFVAEATTKGSKFTFGIRRLQPGETAVFDLQELRDKQLRDSGGNQLSMNVGLGQFKWAVQGVTNGKVTLIGRAEMVSRANMVSTSYSCPTDCGPTYEGSIGPDPLSSLLVGSSSTATAYEMAIFYDGQTNIGPYGAGADWSVTEAAATASPAAGNPTAVTGAAAGSGDLQAYIGTHERFGWDGLSCTDYGAYEVWASAVLNVASVSVDEVGFSGDHKITRWSAGTEIDPTDGSTPTWTRTSNPDDPAAYTKDALPTLFAKLNMSASAPSIAATIRVKNDTTVIATKSVTISGTSVTVTGITTSSSSESTVKQTTPTFTWEISYDSGTHWVALGTTGPHKLYWTYATPLTPSFKDDSGFTYSALYDLALQKAVGYSNGSSALGTIISNNAGVDGDITYNPANSIGSSHPLNAYSQGGGVQCSDLANLLRGLLRSVGISGTTLYIWAGPDSSTLSRYTYSGGSNPSFRIIRGAHDSAVKDPHFKFHAVVSANSTWYDPSYGLSYSTLSFSETANNNTAQQVNSSFWSTDLLSGFVCPH